MLVDIEEFKVDDSEDSEGDMDCVLEGIEESFDDGCERMEVES